MSKEKLSRILGLRLLAIREGVECGAIRELVLDVEDKAVKYLVLDTGKGCFGFRVLPNEKIAGMGKDFAITSSSEYVSDIWTTQTALDLNYTDSDLIGARVVSSSGDVVGKIVDFEFELVQGDITAYVMEDGGVLPKESIVTLSRGIVFIDKEKIEDAIIKESAEDGDASSFELFGSQGGFDLEPEIDQPEAVFSYIEPEAAIEPVEEAAPEIAEEPVTEAALEAEPAQEEAIAEEAPEETPVEIAEAIEAVQEETPPVEEAIQDEAPAEASASDNAEPASAAESAPVVEEPPAEPVSVTSEPTTGRSTASDRLAALRNRAAAAAQQAAAPQEPTTADNADMKNYFEKRRMEFLIGKTVKQQITAADGTVLVEAGQQVTAEMIEKIKAEDKIIELTMGVN